MNFRHPSPGFAIAATAVLASVVLKAPVSHAAAPSEIASARQSLTSEDLMRHVKVLASDEFEGRAPASAGETRTVEYLVNAFKKVGLAPGNPNGSFIQPVPLVGFTSENQATLSVGGKPIELHPPGDYVIGSRRITPETEVRDSDVVFVGYGIEAPEYGWNDYKDVDVRGKTIVMLINDPPIPDPSDRAGLDEKMFKGRAMTYYGRWTYKYEEATRRGAAAALIVHETEPAGYPYLVVISSWGRENFDLQTPDRNLGRVPVEGWLSLGATKRLFQAAGQDFDQLKASALRKDFRPVALSAKADFKIRNHTREVQSQNVVAKLPGSDPKLKDEYVIYTAHWDHLGRNEKLEGDTIYNGALDNATGTAGLLELAEAFTRLDTPPKRSILFLAVTAEEKGLLGAQHYARFPLYPVERTLANLNMDGLNPWGKTHDVEIIGHGNTSLEDLLTRAAAQQGRVTTPDSETPKGRFYRSDHFEFAKVGVPALYLKAGVDFPGKPAGFGKRKSDEYTAGDYHKVSDEVKPDWDFSGAVQDLELLFQVGYEVANGNTYPVWKPGSEFKTRREESLRLFKH